MEEDGNSSGNYFRLDDNNAPKTMPTNPAIAVPSSAASQKVAAMAAGARSTVYSLEKKFNYEATTTNDDYDGEEDDGGLNFPPPPPLRDDIEDNDSLMEDHIGQHHHRNSHNITVTTATTRQTVQTNTTSPLWTTPWTAHLADVPLAMAPCTFSWMPNCN